LSKAKAEGQLRLGLAFLIALKLHADDLELQSQRQLQDARIERARHLTIVSATQSGGGVIWIGVVKCVEGFCAELEVILLRYQETLEQRQVEELLSRSADDACLRITVEAEPWRQCSNCSAWAGRGAAGAGKGRCVEPLLRRSILPSRLQPASVSFANSLLCWKPGTW
jgi:hypothetical protein